MDPNGQPPDEDLIQKAKNGNLAAFNSLVERYQAGVFNLSLRLLGNRQSAEDATQETFLSAYRALARFEGGNFRAWLFRIAANHSKDALRRAQRKDRASSLDEIFDTLGAPVEVADERESSESRVERASVARALQEALLELPFDQRRAIVLVDIHGYSYDEVAGVCETSPGTIKSRIHRGREKLRELIRKDPELFGMRERLES